MMPVVLWTDALLWLLVAAAAGYALYARRHPHLRAPWRRVTRSAAGMVSAVVLAFFVTVGLLDSLHYRPALERQDAEGRTVYAVEVRSALDALVEVRSALDALVEPLRVRTEKTYSAPFATRAYSKETVDLADGKVSREYPRLRHGGVHLADEDDRARDIALKTAHGLAAAIAAWGLCAFLLVWRLSRRRGDSIGATCRAVWRGETEVPWGAMLVTVGCLFVVAFPAAVLSAGYHVLGTDKVGQNVLYLSLKSIRTALVIGGLTTLVMLPFAVLLGIAAGYFKGWVDDVIQYVYTTLNSIPAVLLIAAAVLMMQVYIDSHPDLFPTAAQRADLRLLFLAIILGLTSWTGLARLLRGETLKLRELEYIQAARAFGVGDGRIITRHILPNVMHLVMIALVMDFSGLVLAEAVLSYVGVGVDPTMTSFGTMINSARLELAREPMVWWALAAAFAFMFVLVLAANLFADAVRDAFDPRTRVGAEVAAPAGGKPA